MNKKRSSLDGEEKPLCYRFSVFMKVIRQETEIIDKLWSHVELVFEVIKSNSFVAID